MKKFLIHIFFILLSLACTIGLFLYWTGVFTPSPLVVCLYDDGTVPALHTETLGVMFAKEGIDFETAPIQKTLAETATPFLEAGVQVFILDLDTVPSQEWIDLAAAHNVTLLFTGAKPSDTSLKSYDKIWYLGASEAYAGEEVGMDVALGFREGKIVDANNDLILDYFINEHDTENASPALESTLSTCENYGVYHADILTALSVGGQNADGEEENAETASVQENTNESSDETTEGETDEESSVASEEEHFVLNPDTSNALLRDLPQPEVIFSFGYENARIAQAFAAKQGWLSSETPPAFTLIAESYDVAKQLCSEGKYYTVLYYDTVYATDALFQMTQNAINHRYISYRTDFAHDENATFIIPYKRYSA